MNRRTNTAVETRALNVKGEFELFWNLEHRYHEAPIAERIAWEAAQNPLPGECEDEQSAERPVLDGFAGWEGGPRPFSIYHLTFFILSFIANAVIAKNIRLLNES